MKDLTPGCLPGRFIVIALISLFLAVPALGKGYVQETGHGSIDWFTGRVSAEGIGGAPDDGVSDRAAERLALREALLQARGKLWKAMQAVRISQGNTLGDMMASREDIAERIRGLVHTAPILARERLSGRRLRVRVGLRLRDQLAKEIIPDTIWFDGQRPVQTGRNSQSGSDIGPEDAERARRYTGLIVDAKGLDLHPALMARIFSASGRLLYGPSRAEPDVALENGLIQYVRDLPTALKSGRVGQKPLIIQAESVRARSQCDLVLSDRKSSLLEAARGASDFLRACKVVVIIDRHATASTGG